MAQHTSKYSDHINEFISWTLSLPDDQAIAELKEAKEALVREWRGRISAQNAKPKDDPLHGISPAWAWIGKQMSQRLYPRSGNKYLKHLADKAIKPKSEYAAGNRGEKLRKEAVGKLRGDLKDASDHPRKSTREGRIIDRMKVARQGLSQEAFDDAISLFFDPPDCEKRKLLLKLLQKTEERLATLSADTNGSDFR